MNTQVSRARDEQDNGVVVVIDPRERAEHVVALVAAYLAGNHVSMTDIPDVMTTFSGEVDKLFATPEAPEAPAALNPAVPIELSVTADAIICLEDGLAFKSMKRHLRTKYDMSPEQYRAKWGLPADYPMVAPQYSAARSALAREAGLGLKSTGRPRTVQAEKVEPDANWRETVTEDGFVSKINGRTYKSLASHLKANGLTGDEYKAKFGLPDEYPITAEEVEAFMATA